MSSTKQDFQNNPSREEKIATEREELSRSVVQRKKELLDYVRRGRLVEGKEVMPELIDAFPKLLETQEIDIESDNYNFAATRENVFGLFKQIETEIAGEDKRIRAGFEQIGLKLRQDLYFDYRRAEAIIALFSGYPDSLSNEKLARIPGDSREQKITRVRGNFVKKITGSRLLENEDSKIDEVLIGLESNPNLFLGVVVVVQEPGDSSKGILLNFVCGPKDVKAKYDPLKDGFRKYPRLSEYKGEIFAAESIDFGDVRKSSVVTVLKRGNNPPAGGGVIIDGNIGYKDSGELDEAEGLTIIDHHDNLEQKFAGRKYDTATVMVTRILAEQFKGVTQGTNEGWQQKVKGYIEKFGVVRQTENGREMKKFSIFINHLDSDSILSMWAFKNPGKALKYKEVINAVSTCGDFLLGGGVMDHGATARDYEYIFRNYLAHCEKKIKEDALRPKKLVLVEIDRQISQQGSVESLKKLYEGEEKKALVGVIELQVKLALMETPGKEKAEISRQIREMKDGLRQREPFVSLQKMIKNSEELSKRRVELVKEISQIEKRRTTPEENNVILNYLLGKVEDIITNPFKYQEFLLEGREKEESTKRAVKEMYERGEIEIQTDREDFGILLIEPGRGKTEIPKYESIDGLYFFLRTREDFDKRIVVTHEGKFLSVAINTQNAKDLNTYDFNSLVKELREVEKGTISEKRAALVADGAEKNKKQITELNEDEENNRLGKLWRNRTQMVFCTKTHIPFEKIMRMTRDWKNKTKK